MPRYIAVQDRSHHIVTGISDFLYRRGQPIVVDTDGIIVVGHTRFLAANKLGLERVPVHIAIDLTPAQAKAYRIADNATNEIAEWDYDLQLGSCFARNRPNRIQFAMQRVDDPLH